MLSLLATLWSLRRWIIDGIFGLLVVVALLLPAGTSTTSRSSRPIAQTGATLTHFTIAARPASNPCDTNVIGIPNNIFDCTLHNAIQDIGIENILKSMGFVFTTDKNYTYGNGFIQYATDAALGIANAMIVMMLLIIGYQTLFGAAFSSAGQSAKHQIPQLLGAIFAANSSLFFCQLIIDFNNGLVEVMVVKILNYGQVTPASGSVSDGIIAYLETVAKSDVSQLLYLLLIIIVLIFVFQMAARLALVDLLLIFSPLAFLCWGLPQSQAWAKLWLNTFLSTVFTQALQVIALFVSFKIITSIANGSNDIVTIIWALGTLYTILKIPDLLRNLNAQGGGMNYISTTYFVTSLFRTAAAAA